MSTQYGTSLSILGASRLFGVLRRIRSLKCTAKRSRVSRRPIRYEKKTVRYKQTNLHCGLGMAILYEIEWLSCKRNLRISSPGLVCHWWLSLEQFLAYPSRGWRYYVHVFHMLLEVHLLTCICLQLFLPEIYEHIGITINETISAIQNQFEDKSLC